MCTVVQLCVMDMICIWRVMSCMGLKVKMPTIVEVDNKGCDNFGNNQSVAGRARHIEVKQYYLIDLKELGILEAIWMSGKEMLSNIFTKNLLGPVFNKMYRSKVFSQDEYYNQAKVKDRQMKELPFFVVEAYKEHQRNWSELINDWRSPN